MKRVLWGVAIGLAIGLALAGVFRAYLGPEMAMHFQAVLRACGF
jgi:hypothetical protein